MTCPRNFGPLKTRQTASSGPSGKRMRKSRFSEEQKVKMLRETEQSSIAGRQHNEAGDDFVLDAVSSVVVAVGKGGLGRGTPGRPWLVQNVAKLEELSPKRADDGRYVVTRAIAEFANHGQSLRLSGGGGGNRTLRAAIR